MELCSREGHERAVVFVIICRETGTYSPAYKYANVNIEGFLSSSRCLSGYVVLVSSIRVNLEPS